MKAVALYQQSLEIMTADGKKNLNKDDPWVYVYLGLSYAKKGDTAQAVETWKQVPMTIGKVYRTIQDQIAKYSQQTAEAK